MAQRLLQRPTDLLHGLIRRLASGARFPRMQTESPMVVGLTDSTDPRDVGLNKTAWRRAVYRLYLLTRWRWTFRRLVGWAYGQ